MPDAGEMARLVEDERIAELLAEVSPRDIARSWLAYHAAPNAPDRDENWWAIALFLSREWWFYQGDVPLRATLDQMIEQAGDRQELLEIIGAGPLEDYLDNISAELYDGKDSRLRWLEQRLAATRAWRTAIMSAYRHENHPDQLWSRIKGIIRADGSDDD